MDAQELGIALAGLFFGLLSIIFFISLGIWALAKSNLFFSIVEEGRARAILYNGAFRKCVMSYHDRIFRKDLPDAHPKSLANTKRENLQPEDLWEVMDDPAPVGSSRVRLPFMRNIYWIGVPPFSSIHKYRFEWTSLEEVPNKTTGRMEKAHKWKEEPEMAHILVQADSYVSILSSAECLDKIPLRIVFIIYGEIVNPYKALFKVQKWLETTQNLIGAALREYTAEKSYNDMLKTRGDAGKDILFDETEKVRTQILKEIGFKVISLRLESIDPDGKLADEFVRGTTRVIIAKNQAEADAIEGKGKADRATAYYKAVKELGAEGLFIAEAIQNSKLTTLVNGGAGNTGIVLNPNAEPPRPTTSSETSTNRS